MVMGRPKTSKPQENADLPQHGANGIAAQSQIGGGGAIEPLSRRVRVAARAQIITDDLMRS
jgi:hypothetical protein